MNRDTSILLFGAPYGREQLIVAIINLVIMGPARRTRALAAIRRTVRRCHLDWFVGILSHRDVPWRIACPIYSSVHRRVGASMRARIIPISSTR